MEHSLAGVVGVEKSPDFVGKTKSSGDGKGDLSCFRGGVLSRFSPKSRCRQIVASFVVYE